MNIDKNTRSSFRGAVHAPRKPSPISLPTRSPRRDEPPARVRVGREVAGRGGKGVTVISGLPLAAPDIEAFAGRLKRLCGAGGRIAYPDTGTASQGGHPQAGQHAVIEIQGEHRDRLVAELRKLGYDAKRSGG